jgi:hypothetical protein
MALCYRGLMGRGAWVLAAALAFAQATPAQLQRFLPSQGQLGELSGQQQQPYPLLQIDNKVVRLAPGGRIYDQHNRTIVHGALPDSASVLFVPDMHGDIARLYILLPAEVERVKLNPPAQPATTQ